MRKRENERVGGCTEEREKDRRRLLNIYVQKKTSDVSVINVKRR